MSKKEYADQTRTYTAYFRAGEHQERRRILNLIKEKIDPYIIEEYLDEIVEELEKKK